MSRADVVFDLVGREPADEAVVKGVLFRRILLLNAVVHGWTLVARGGEPAFHRTALLSAVLLSGAALLSFDRRFEWSATALALGAAIGRLIATFPSGHNHLYLEVFLLVGVASTWPRSAAETRLALQYARWVVLIVLFWSGAQKILHGCYFEGEFLAWASASSDRYTALLAPIAAGDLEQLRAIAADPERLGPYRFQAPLLLLGSNLIWIAEIALPIGLLLRRTRPAALAASVLFFLAIAAVARELVFGALFLSTVLLFASARTYRRCAPAIVAALAAILVAQVALTDIWLN